MVARRKCIACGSWCHWHDVVWVCDDLECDSKWVVDDDPRYGIPPGVHGDPLNATHPDCRNDRFPQCPPCATILRLMHEVRELRQALRS